MTTPLPFSRPLAPNWFAAVMGTGIVALALDGMPVHLPWARPVSVFVWVVAVLLLVGLGSIAAADWVRAPRAALEALDDPVLAHFHGAPAMALMTVGAGALLIGSDLTGSGPAVVVDLALWTVGTALGLLVVVVVPVRAITRHRIDDDSAFGGWLMSVVAPMVSAATGALLVPHLPAGQPRQTMFALCVALAGLTFFVSLVMITAIWHRLLRHGPGPSAMVPTVWIVLGPLGQSVTAAHHLAGAAPAAFAVDPRLVDLLAVALAVPVWGFAVVWLAVAVGVTRHAHRAGTIPFTLAWWSFVFPLGTVVTGTSGLAGLTGLGVFTVLAVAGMLALTGTWLVTGSRTVAAAGRHLASHSWPMSKDQLTPNLSVNMPK